MVVPLPVAERDGRQDLESAARGTNGKRAMPEPRIIKSYLIHLGGASESEKGKVERCRRHVRVHVRLSDHAMLTN